MRLKIAYLITISLCYILILLSISVLTVFIVTPIHTPFLGDDDLKFVDSAISGYIIHGDEERLQAETGLTRGETSHMSDVRDIVLGITAFGVISAVALVFMRPRKRIERAVMLASPSYLHSLTGSVVAISLVVGFSKVFKAFHQIFFPQGNYLFSPSSILIRTYPESFFAVQGLVVFLIFTCLSILLLYLYHKNE
ncbi:MAG: DUF1461 domain-containing protein [Nanoarchaeota archaeon]